MIEAHRRLFGSDPEGVWAAPGRVNVIGEHVDYNGGLCLPIALAQRTRASVRRRRDHLVRVASTAVDDGITELDDLAAATGWTRYVAGALLALQEAGVAHVGLDVLIDSAVPVGAGLSSSAALICSVALAVAELGASPLAADRSALAAVCVRAEIRFVGAPTGGMDQAAALLGREGHALLLDCRDGGVEHLPFDLVGAGLVLLVIDTRVAHRNLDGEYGSRRRACERAAARLAVPSLREATIEAVATLPDDVRAAVRHVVTEIARVERAAALLRASRIEAIGPLLDESHRSLRDDFAVSCRELDLAVDTARAAGALGARMTGGGFGGSAIALVPAPLAPTVERAVVEAFDESGLAPPALLAATASGPASRVA